MIDKVILIAGWLQETFNIKTKIRNTMVKFMIRKAQ